ncbi:MAG: ACP S-malonyltransferase [Gammaproteobacteria bacterium]|nr:ACP S-malonyltransferase [Pseudomonadales bacterium]MCP5346252.1 ACP S-malonyltransferase [Pseudomonadales bacterium]
MRKFGFVFPGQGSQKLGMLAELADHHPELTDTFSEASSVIGQDLWETCQHDTTNNLDQTEITQPVLLTASVAIWRLWKAAGAADPAIMAGHSLGEYSALVCAGVLDFADAVRLVHKRGQYMQQAVPAGTGAMAAIVGLEDYQIREVCQQVAEGQVVSAANYNSPGQTVIAGDAEAVNRAMVALKEAGAKRALPLKVSVPSHCALMKPAADRLAADLEAIAFRPAAIPVVQNVNAEVATEANSIKQNLLGQLHQPVLWVDSIRLISQGGIRMLVECGPGKVLCGLIKRIEADIACFGSDDVQSFQQACEEVSG